MEGNIIDEQLGYLKKNLVDLDKIEICKFIALNLKLFLFDKQIFSFLNELNSNTEYNFQYFVNKVINNEQIDLNYYKSFFSSISWDVDEIDNKLFDASEGALKALGGIELLIEYMQKGKFKDALNASIQFLEQVDYYIMLSEENPSLNSKAKELFTNQISNEKQAIIQLKKSIYISNLGNNDLSTLIEHFYRI